MRKIVLALSLALALAGCSTVPLGTISTIERVATATVPAGVVIPTANAFNILKAGATNYGRYCIQQRMAPQICDPDFRRNVIRAVRSGTAARNQMRNSLVNGEPAAASVYNILVAAVHGLQASPAANAQFTGAAQ